MWEVVGLSQFQESITLRLVGSSLYAGGFKESKMGEQSPIPALPRLDIPSAGVSSGMVSFLTSFHDVLMSLPSTGNIATPLLNYDASDARQLLSITVGSALLLSRQVRIKSVPTSEINVLSLTLARYSSPAIPWETSYHFLQLHTPSRQLDACGECFYSAFRERRGVFDHFMM